MTEKRTVYIVDGLRTALTKGRVGGLLSNVHPADLLSIVLKELLGRLQLDPVLLDDVIGGCVTQTGEQSTNITRSAVLAAGFPVSVAATTVDRQCGSSQQAIAFAAQGIAAGAYDLAVACGVESMSRTPMFSNRAGKEPFGPLVGERYKDGLVPQGISAELVASKWNLDRQSLDEYAMSSHLRAAAARDRGTFQQEIVPVMGNGRLITEDQGIREVDQGVMAALPAIFKDPVMAQRFPEIEWVISAGNSSQISDGAAAVMLASEDAVRKYGLTPRARITHNTVIGDDPLLMLSAIIPATQLLLKRARLEIEDISIAEVNEAFASPVLAWIEEMGAERDRVNVNGGAISLGHPLGASGVRLMISLLSALEESGGRFGMQTMCEAGGMANASLIERL